MANGEKTFWLNGDPLDPALCRIGLLAGLLEEDTGTNRVSLNEAWFQNPLQELKKIPAERTDRLYSLVGDLGLKPESEGSDQWFPFTKPGSDPPEATDFFLVRRQSVVADVASLGYRYRVASSGLVCSVCLPLCNLKSGAFLPGPVEAAI